ncbi:MAG: YigZ family protein, partial [Acidobacteriota bacterium]
THHVPAYLIGHGTAVSAHCQDDGEPSGTAGRPVLSVLQGSGLGDVAVVVTRYFGGTKLGSGGLVRAYSEAVRQVLRELPVAEKRLAHTVLLACPYSGLKLVRQAVQRVQGQILEEEFAAQVTLTLRLPADRYKSFQEEIAQISNAAWMPEIQETSAEIFAPRRQGAK